MNCFVELGVLSLKLIFALFIPICRNVRSISFEYLNISNRMKKYPFILTCVLFFSEILGGLVKYLLCCNKSSKKPKKVGFIITGRTMISTKFTPDHKKEVKLQNGIVLFITFLCLIENNLPVFVNQNIPYSITNLRYQLKMIGIVFYPWLCLKILKYKLYRHQYFSLGLIILGVILVLFKSLSEYKSEWYWIILYIFSYSLVGVERTCEKWLMNNKFWSPYKVLLYQGIIGLVVSIVLEVILALIPCPNGWFCQGNPSIENPIDLFKEADWPLILYVLLFLVFIGNVYFWSIMVNFFFSPAHLAMTEILSSIVHLSLNFKYTMSTLDILTISGYIIITLAILLYNEIIIFNFLGLGDNTTKKIMSRSRADSSEANISMTIINEEEIMFRI